MEKPLYRFVDKTLRWFPFLKSKEHPEKSLIFHIIDSQKSVHGLTIIYCEYRPESYMYTYFENYKLFINYYIKFVRKFGVDLAFFGEVILGAVNQKIKFDIDIKDPTAFHLYDECIRAVVETAEDVLSEWGIPIDRCNDVIVTSSHGTNKRSGHVIIDNYHHCNSGEAKHFFGIVYERIDPKLKPYIDSGVYKSLQNFRSIGCTKPGAPRVKMVSSWVDSSGNNMRWMDIPEGKVNDPELMFKASLITCCFHCKALPDFGYTAYVDTKAKVEINDALVNIALLMLDQYSCDDDGPIYEFMNVEDNFIYVKRKRPARCVVCDGYHDKQNGKIVIKGVDIIELFFDCLRRPPDVKMFYLGMLESPNVKKYEVKIPLLEGIDFSKFVETEEDVFDIPTDEIIQEIDSILGPYNPSLYQTKWKKQSGNMTQRPVLVTKVINENPQPVALSPQNTPSISESSSNLTNSANLVPLNQHPAFAYMSQQAAVATPTTSSYTYPYNTFYGMAGPQPSTLYSHPQATTPVETNGGQQFQVASTASFIDASTKKAIERSFLPLGNIRSVTGGNVQSDIIAPHPLIATKLPERSSSNHIDTSIGIDSYSGGQFGSIYSGNG